MSHPASLHSVTNEQGMAHASATSSNHGASNTNSPSAFTIPAIFDASYYNTPDIHSLIVHSMPSSADDEGFQAILSFHARPNIPVHLGLPSLPSYEEKAFLQVSPANTPFIFQTHVARTHAMLVTVTEYLILLQFVINDWPRLKSKLDSQLATMREATDPVYMSGHLMFYSHGSSHFRASLSSRLVFRASVDSHDPTSKLKTWLERRSPSADSESYQELHLPMDTLSLLVQQDATGFISIVDQMAAYKSRSRKRNKSVIP